MELGSFYIVTKNYHSFKETIEFYKNILEEEPYLYNEARWVEFKKFKLSVYCEEYDQKLIHEAENIDKHFNKAYLDNFGKEGSLKNNAIIINLYCENLNHEYKRLKKLGIKVSEFMRVHTTNLYWYFNAYDPNGNVIEITGNYNEEDQTKP